MLVDLLQARKGENHLRKIIKFTHFTWIQMYSQFVQTINNLAQNIIIKCNPMRSDDFLFVEKS